MKNARTLTSTEKTALLRAHQIVAEISQKKISSPRQKTLLRSFNTVSSALSEERAHKLRIQAINTIAQSPNATGAFATSLTTLVKTNNERRPSGGFYKWYRNPVCADLI